jgi:CheY-like chemotaxis protein
VGFGTVLGTRGAEGEGDADDPARPHVIVLAEDDAVMRTLLRDTLAPDYEVEEARDGAEALELCRRLRPSLVVLDHRMPCRTGADVLGELRADPALGGTPVVMLSSDGSAEQYVSEDGAARFMRKPFSPRELLDVVAELLP